VCNVLKVAIFFIHLLVYLLMFNRSPQLCSSLSHQPHTQQPHKPFPHWSVSLVLPKSGSVRFITLYLRTPNSTSGQVQARWPNPGPDAFERVRKGSVQVQNVFEPSNR
jgi:hypothetical protein